MMRSQARSFRIRLLIGTLILGLLLPLLVPTAVLAQTYTADNRHPDYSYDDNGNRLSTDGSDAYTYDTAGRLVSSNVAGKTVAYKYDGIDNLVQVTENGTTIDLVLNELSPLPTLLGEIESGSVRQYAYGIDGVHAQKVDGSVQYALKDHQGTVRHLTDAAGTIAHSRHYDAWGRVRHQTNTAGPRLGFTGEREMVDGTVHLRARQYQPSTGLFLQRDSIDAAAYGAGTQGHNRYSYVNNNPVQWTDPSGHAPQWMRETKKWLGRAACVASVCTGLAGNPAVHDFVEPILPSAKELSGFAGMNPDSKPSQTPGYDYDKERRQDPDRQGNKNVNGDPPKRQKLLPPAGGTARPVDVEVVGGEMGKPKVRPNRLPGPTIDVSAVRVPDGAGKGLARGLGRNIIRALPFAGAAWTLANDPANAAGCLTAGSIADAALGEVPVIGDIFGAEPTSNGELPDNPIYIEH